MMTLANEVQQSGIADSKRVANEERHDEARRREAQGAMRMAYATRVEES
jgi:hypothetical protein